MKIICTSLPTFASASLLISAVGSIPLLANAGTATLLPAADNRGDSFYTASRWNPAVAPNNYDGTQNPDGADTDFVVCDNIRLVPHETTVEYVFGGRSLSVGAADRSSGGIFKQKGNGRYISFSDVRLYKGSWEQHNNGWMGLKGDATVYSPASDPFVFRLKEQYENRLNFRFHGTKGSAIRIDWIAEHSNKKPIYLQADQSETYSGSWIIGTNVYIYAYPNAEYGGNKTSAMQFGKPLEDFNPAALVMEKGSILRYELGGNPRKFAASDNRGLTVDAEGGFATYRLVNGFKHDFGWPIAGKGALKITGNGTFNLRASCGVQLCVEEGLTKLTLCDGASITAAGGLLLRDGGMFSLEKDTDRVTVHNIDAANAMIKLPVSADGKSCALLRLAGNVNLSGVTSIGFTQVPLVSERIDVPVIAIDSSVQRVFDSDDFNPYGVTGAQLPNASGVKVVRDAETGDQIVYVTLIPCVKTCVSDGNSNPGHFAAWAWGDKSIDPAVGDGNNYLTWNTHIMHNGEGEEFTVPGSSLILYNPTKEGFSFNLRHKKTICPHLLALDRSIVEAFSYYTGNTPNKGQPHELAGHVEVQTTPGNKFTLSAKRSQIKVSARITGTGTIRARSEPRFYTPQCTVQVMSVNPEYRGYFHAYNSVDVVTNTIAFKIAEEGNLGGNPHVFSSDAFRLGYGCIFMPSAEVTIDDGNRGVTFAASTNVESTVRTGPILDLAYDFTVKTPVVFESGELVKTNSGTFAWGLAGSTVSEGTKLSVKGGAVKPQGLNAFGPMEIAFAKGTVLAMDFPLAEDDSRSAYGVDMRTVRMSHADEKLAVRLEADDVISARSVSVPLATFADSASAEAFAETIDISVPCGWSVELSVSAQTIGDDSVTTLKANLVKTGSRIIIR